MSKSPSTQDDEPTQVEATGPTGHSNDPSVGELLSEQDVKRRIKAIAGTMAVVGIALSLMVFLMGSFGANELTQDATQELTPQQQQLQEDRYTFNLISSVFQNAPFVAFGISTIAGLLVGIHTGGGRRRVVVTAAAGAFVGTIALVLLTEFIASTQIPSLQGNSYSLDGAQALVNSVLIGVVAAVVGSGGAYFGRELA